MGVRNSKERDRFWEAYRGCTEENRVRPDRSTFYVNTYGPLPEWFFWFVARMNRIVFSPNPFFAKRGIRRSYRGGKERFNLRCLSNYRLTSNFVYYRDPIDGFIV